MASLLSKFRIDYQSLKMVSGITEKPKTETVKFFDKLLEGLREEDGGDPGETWLSDKYQNTSQNDVT